MKKAYILLPFLFVKYCLRHALKLFRRVQTQKTYLAISMSSAGHVL